LTAFVRQGRWYLIDFARGRPTNPARIPVGRPGRWYYPRPSGCRVGLLVNFNCVLLKDGLHHFIA
jgi:hypothetical protein